MTWTNISKAAATWAHTVKNIIVGYLLQQNGGYLLLQNGGKIILNGTEDWTKPPKYSSSWTLKNK